MIKIGNSLLFAFVFAFAIVGHAAGKIQVVGSVDRNEMSVGDTFTYTVAISSDSSLNVADPRLPPLQGLELINSWTGSESRSTFTNGTFQVEQSRTFSYQLATTQAGTLTLGEAQVTVDGQVYKTQPIRIRVLEAGNRPQAPPQAGQGAAPDTIDDMEDLFNQLLQRRLGPGTRTQPVNPDEAFFIQAEVDKTKVYVGEQVTATWYLYTRGQVHDIDTLKYPSLSGFWKEEIELATRLNFQQEVVNGIVYQKALLASYALFPIKPGTASVDSYKAKCTVSVPAMMGFSRPYQFTKTSRPIPIEVVDVPKENRPADFYGAVGNFTAQAAVEQTTVVAHQPLALRVKYEGRGNAKLIDLPKLDLPAGVELYDTKQEAKFFREGTSFKQFELSLIPRQAGAVTIPSVTTSAFDPVEHRFYSLSTQPVVLNVLSGAGPQTLPSEPLAIKERSESPRQGPQLPNLMMEWEASDNWQSAQIWGAWLAVYGGIVALLLWRGLIEFGWLRRKRQLHQLFQIRLKKLRSKADKKDWRGVGVEGTNLVYFVLGEVTELGGANLELSKLLLRAPPSVRRECAESITKVMQVLEVLSFAPEEMVGPLKESTSLQQTVGEIAVVLGKVIRLSSREEESSSNTVATTST